MFTLLRVCTAYIAYIYNICTSVLLLLYFYFIVVASAVFTNPMWLNCITHRIECIYFSMHACIMYILQRSWTVHIHVDISDILGRSVPGIYLASSTIRVSFVYKTRFNSDYLFVYLYFEYILAYLEYIKCLNLSTLMLA